MRRLLRSTSRSTDLALAYAAVVLVVFVVLQFQPEAVQAGFVQDSSTNLENLRQFPFRVLLLSALVVPDAAGLWILVLLVVALTACTRWVGRVCTVLVFGFGHVGATLVVSVVLVAGITHGRLDPGIARAPDVGVSYGLACVVGLLAARVPRWARVPYVLVPVAALTAVLVLAPDFTAVGHLVALAVGFALAWLAHRVRALPVPR